MNEGHFVEEASNVIYPKLGLETGAHSREIYVYYISLELFYLQNV